MEKHGIACTHAMMCLSNVLIGYHLPIKSQLKFRSFKENEFTFLVHVLSILSHFLTLSYYVFLLFQFLMAVDGLG